MIVHHPLPPGSRTTSAGAGAGSTDRPPRRPGGQSTARPESGHPGPSLEPEYLGLAHELGNRTMIVSAQLQMVVAAGELAQEQLDAVRAAERALEALVATGERLLALAGPPAPAVSEVVDLRALAREVVAEAEMLVDAAGGSRITVHGSRPAPVTAVRSQLRLVVDNLVENALKYSPPGSPVVVEVRPHRGGVVLRVLDRGVGIAPRDLPHVQEPFFRSRAAEDSDRQGAGMGLAIARGLVERHGGHLGIASQPGRGTRVTVLLPPHVEPIDDERA